MKKKKTVKKKMQQKQFINVFHISKRVFRTPTAQAGDEEYCTDISLIKYNNLLVFFFFVFVLSFIFLRVTE